MSLLDLKTDLKSLKYGKDRPGGGDSGQPYQKVDINTVDSGFNRFRMTKFDDGLVRGGVVGAANASIVDTFRIGKFLTDFPKGPLFIAKQIGLQMSNPVLETNKLKTDSPTKGGGLLRNVGNFVLNTANKIVNAVGPTRIYNLGINTLAQVPVGAFGIHFNRHGLLPVQDDQTKTDAGRLISFLGSILIHQKVFSAWNSSRKQTQATVDRFQTRHTWKTQKQFFGELVSSLQIVRNKRYDTCNQINELNEIVKSHI